MTFTQHARTLLADALHGGGRPHARVVDPVRRGRLRRPGRTGLFRPHVSEECPTDLSGEAGPRTTTVRCRVHRPQPGRHRRDLSEAVRPPARPPRRGRERDQGLGGRCRGTGADSHVPWRQRGGRGGPRTRSLDLTLIWEPYVECPHSGPLPTVRLQPRNDRTAAAHGLPAQRKRSEAPWRTWSQTPTSRSRSHGVHPDRLHQGFSVESTESADDIEVTNLGRRL